MAITRFSFDFVRKMLQETSGQSLDDGKVYLVEARLTDLASREGYKSVDEFIIHLHRNGCSQAMRRSVTEAMPTETYFFRDVYPFEVLKTYLIPEMLKRRGQGQTITIWSAACSRGQEPYSLAILIEEHFSWVKEQKFRIIGSDLSLDVLKQARSGIYSQMEVNRGLAPALLSKYFIPDSQNWKVRDDLKRKVEFMEINLTSAWPLLSADIIFLRNVLIYFEDSKKREILTKVRRIMPDDGALFLGSGETTIGIDIHFEAVNSGNTVYYNHSKK